MSDVPARDGHVIHAKAAQRTTRLFIPASSRFKGCQLSSGIRAGVDAQGRERSGQREVGVGDSRRRRPAGTSLILIGPQPVFEVQGSPVQNAGYSEGIVVCSIPVIGL